jgi:pimeloyl-ACP methyl ester carboxylesterase
MTIELSSVSETAMNSAANQSIKVMTPDGLCISAQVWGEDSRYELVFIHGMLQCQLSWSRQIQHLMARNIRLTTYDFRGHGASDKPLDPSLYNDPGRFADELNAVIETVGLKRPILVGWSFGTRIVADYVLKYGGAKLAGINFVAPAISPDPDHFGPSIKKLAEARDEDFAKSILGTRAFLRACFLREPARDEFETMLVYNASVPLPVRRWFGRATSDSEALQSMLRSLTLPTLISHGLEDTVIRPELSRWLGTILPAAQTSFYQNSGHAPFFEEAERFNSELAAFVLRANGDA